MLIDINKADEIMELLFPGKYRSLRYEFSSYQGNVFPLYTVYTEDYGHKSSNFDFLEAIYLLRKDGKVVPIE